MSNAVKSLIANFGVAFVLLAIMVGLLAWWLTEYTAETEAPLPPCATEDSDNCYWDADTMGNGEGRSFTVRDGVVTYEGEK